MAAILCCATPNHGHVRAVLDVARQLSSRGHRVQMLTGSRHLAQVREAGIEPLALGPQADINLDDPNESFPQRAGLTGMRAIRFDLLNLFVEPVIGQHEALRDALAASATDVVLVEPSFAAAGLLLEASRPNRPAVVTLGITPLTLPGADLAPFGMGVRPAGGPWGRVRNAVLHRMAHGLMRPVQARRAQIEETLGARIPGESLFEWVAHADLHLQLTVPSFEYPRELPEGVHFVGPVGQHLPGGGALPDWWGELDDGRPVVHVTQGTIANKDLDQLIKPALSGLAGLDAHVVVSLGGRPVGDLAGTVPDNARVASYLPYDKLLPRTDVLVTNGGYGGVQLALAHGIPVVVSGRTEDKPEVGARVAWSGVGVDLRKESPRPAAVARAVERVLADASYRERARGMATEIAQAPGFAGIDTLLAEVRAG